MKRSIILALVLIVSGNLAATTYYVAPPGTAGATTGTGDGAFSAIDCS